MEKEIEAILEITAGIDNVQISNFGTNSFVLQNSGQKRIAAVFIDVSTSIYQDVVFDDDGTGGDNVVKPLRYNNNGENVGAISINNYDWLWLPVRSVANPSGAFDPNALSDVNNLYLDATANVNGLPSPKAGGGYHGELLLF